MRKKTNQKENKKMNKISQLPQRIFHFFANANAVAFAYGRVYDYIDATTSKALEMLKTIYIYILC